MTEQEISDWEREINHAQMMWRLAYKHEVNKRNEQMAWNEAQANQAMAATIEQERLDARQLAAAEANEVERQRKRDINAQFWHSIKSVVFVISCAALVIYTLIHFA